MRREKDGSDPYAALRYAAFRDYALSRLLFTFSLLMQEVIIGYEIYKITHDPLSLGLIGLAEAAPFIALSLFGGYFADRMSRRKILLGTLSGIILCSGLLFAISQNLSEALAEQSTRLWMIYGCLALIGALKAFHSPASQALRAHMTPRSAYANASTWNSAAWQIGAIAGPASSGFLYALAGFGNTLLVVIGLLIATLLLIIRLPDAPVNESPKQGGIAEDLKEGIRFVRKTKTVLYPLSLDLFSVLFGGVISILPIFAEDILHVGSRGLGIMRAAPYLGAVITILLLSRFSPMRRAWRNLLMAVTGFGLATLAFAVSKDFTLSVVLLFLTGAFDSVSVVIRSTILQLVTPDEMRGRVSAVNGIFISSSNELGGLESGVAAKLMGAVPSVLFGGTVTLAVIGFMYFTSKELLGRKFDG